MASAIAINSSGNTVYGNIHYRLQNIWYKFNTNKTGKYRIETSGNIDTVGYLYDSEGCLIGSDHDSGSWNNFLIDADLEKNKTYYICITTYGTTTGTFGITVTPFVPVSSITLNKTSLVMLPNQSENLVATVHPSNATIKDVQWFSNVPEVAEVNGGWICSNEEGSTTIYARAKDGSGVEATCTIVVSTNKVTSIELNHTSLELTPGEEKELIARPLPENATNKNLYWFSTCPEVADVTAGWVCAKAEGTAQIYACARDGSGTTAICEVTVVTNKVESIDIESTLNLLPGQSQYILKEILPPEANNKSLYWFSTCPEVADVAYGWVCANSGGTAQIYACATDGSGTQAKCDVTVAKTFVTSIRLSDTSITLKPGESQELEATPISSVEENPTIYWRSDNPSVADVNYGWVCANSVGTTTIYAYAVNGVQSACTVTVSPVFVSSIEVIPATVNLTVGDEEELCCYILPPNATNKGVKWSSNKTSVATVNPDTGMVIAQGVGTATITATAQDGSNKKGYCTITVNPPVAVTGVEVCPTSLTMNVGDIEYVCATITPSNATNQEVTWCSSNDNVATVGLYTGKITAKKAGTTTITATTADGGYSDSCEVWVHGKTPIFLIHGRTSNSNDVWGINNNIPSGMNDDFKSDINAVALNGEKYIDVDSQALCEFEPNKGNSDTDYPCNLGNKLLDAGYKENVNLFAFNYPNQDAVVHSAKKFEKYIENLIDDVRTSGADEKKACFYASRNDYNNNNYKINIVGHSMGGLVARYYIENLYQDCRVDKLITICTPHWGSGYADLSNLTGDLFGIKLHVLCDHDLDFDSAMYGGSNSTTVNCDKGTCPESNYIVTSALQYQCQRSTKYYAIAGIDYPGGPIIQNDYWFEMSTNYTTYQQIDNFMVGFMSQIGWTENIGNTPNKKIPMEKIFIDVDTNGGNGGGVFIWEVANGLGSEIFHNKAPHRIPVCNKVIEYLEV